MSHPVPNTPNFPEKGKQRGDSSTSTSEDRIHALLGLGSGFPVPDITISYDKTHSVQQVYTYAHFVKCWIRLYHDLDIISIWIDCYGHMDGCPSWIPNWCRSEDSSHFPLGASNTMGRSEGFSAWTVDVNEGSRSVHGGTPAIQNGVLICPTRSPQKDRKN
jgi:hypothetical protein